MTANLGGRYRAPSMAVTVHRVEIAGWAWGTGLTRG